MSDESQPPPLRLKPRSRPVEPGTDASSAPAAPVTGNEASAPPPAERGDTTPRLRLKPKLSLPTQDSAPASAPAEPPPSSRSSAPPPALSAPEPPQAAPAPGPDTSALLRPKLRLATEQPKGASLGSVPASPIEPSPALAPEPSPLSVPPQASPPPSHEQVPTETPADALSEEPAATVPSPEPATAPAIDPSKFPPPPVRKPAPPEASRGESLARPPGAPAPGAARPENRPLFKMALLVVTVAAVGVLAAGLYFAYNTYVAGDSAPPTQETSVATVQPSPKQPTAPAATPPEKSASKTESETRVKSPTSGIASRVRQTTDAAAARVAEIPLDESDPATQTSPRPVQPTPATSETTSSPPVAAVEQPAPPPRAAEPDAAFQLWVSEARVSGIRRGEEARAFINGRLVRQGELVDSQLGIRFEGIDPSQNILLFRDRFGAVIGKKF